ncbi:MAG TPA: glycoside hydrolase family 44 protein, partial [Rhodanobacteraceae bacterium]|nr:glycoside hydrolase family 44 protein [Rhodanobacteraceae bacterium]
GSAADNCLDGPDRQAHGGMPFVAWYLQQVCANPLPGGARVVDVLDLHYYPQGANVALSDDDSPDTAARRLRSLKELYDAAWVSESWISDLGDGPYHYDKPNLIPRARAWIDQYCPGTKLAITEYNWGNDDTTSGAVAQAELFGIFAREGVDLATRWVAPEANTRVERAYTLFLDYDGAGSKVDGASAAATSADVDTIGAYAFAATGGRTIVLLTNKDAASHDAAITFADAHAGGWRLFGFDGANPVHQIASGTIAGASLTVSALPPISASLLVIEGGDAIFGNGFD